MRRAKKMDDGYRYILIDDDPAYGSVMREIAWGEGIELDVYHSLADLGSVGLLGRYDVAIVDYELGELNGVEIGEYLTAFFGDIPMVLISATTRRAERDVHWPPSIKTFIHKSEGFKAILTDARRLRGRSAKAKKMANRGASMVADRAGNFRVWSDFAKFAD